MPAIAHSGTGLAAQKALPIVHVILLFIAEFIEIIFMVLLRPGIEHPATNTIHPYSPFAKYTYGTGLYFYLELAAILVVYADRKTNIYN